MWISTKAQYGMRALVEVALGGDEPTSLKTVAERQNLSHQYLEQIFAVLRRAGIVESVRGARGGYRVARPLGEVPALEVVELLEGSVAPVTCIDDEANCLRVGHCSTEVLWRRVDLAVRQVLGSISLGDLVAQRRMLNLEPIPEAEALGGVS
jgi:Rrf2 family transcriptional regulator, cysteine metabolism repressor